MISGAVMSMLPLIVVIEPLPMSDVPASMSTLPYVASVLATVREPPTLNEIAAEELGVASIVRSSASSILIRTGKGVAVEWLEAADIRSRPTRVRRSIRWGFSGVAICPVPPVVPIVMATVSPMIWPVAKPVSGEVVVN